MKKDVGAGIRSALTTGPFQSSSWINLLVRLHSLPCSGGTGAGTFSSAQMQVKLFFLSSLSNVA